MVHHGGEVGERLLGGGVKHFEGEGIAHGSSEAIAQEFEEFLVAEGVAIVGDDARCKAWRVELEGACGADVVALAEAEVEGEAALGLGILIIVGHVAMAEGKGIFLLARFYDAPGLLGGCFAFGGEGDLVAVGSEERVEFAVGHDFWGDDEGVAGGEGIDGGSQTIVCRAKGGSCRAWC